MLRDHYDSGSTFTTRTDSLFHPLYTKKEGDQGNAKGRLGKVSNKGPIFCPLLLVAFNLTYQRYTLGSKKGKETIALYSQFMYLCLQSCIQFQCNLKRPILLQKGPSSHQACLLFYVFLHHL